MLSKKDVTLLRGMFQEQEDRFDKKMREEFGFHTSKFDQKLDDLKVNLRDEIHSCISASETRMMQRMDEIKEEIIDGITEVIDEGILPQISDLQADMRRVKNHLQMA